MDVLRKQKERLANRVFARSNIKNKMKHCPVCEQNRKNELIKRMSEIKKEFQTSNQINN